MKYQEVLSVIIVLAAAVLAGLHVLPAEAFITLVGGVFLKNPLARPADEPTDEQAPDEGAAQD